MYGFQAFKANRDAFICRVYEQDFGVGVRLRGNHRAAVGKGYYIDDINLCRICLHSYFISSCPPRGVPCKGKGLQSETLIPYTDARPLYFYRSCLLPPVDLPIAVRLSSDSYMHMTHLANYWSSNPLSVSTKDVANITELPVGLFGSVAPALVASVGAPVTP
jgi:hypothetical protein